MSKVTDEVRGRWKEVLPRLGVEKKFLSGKSSPCPACGGRDRFCFTDRTKSGDYICRQCGAGFGLGLVMKVNGWDAKTAVKAIRRVIGGGYITPLDRAHRAARAFFDSCPDLPSLWEPPKATAQATLWLRKYHPKSLPKWLAHNDPMLEVWLSRQV